MAVKFFGQFLLEQGVIGNEKLLAAIALQDATNLKFGEMAKSMGLITDGDIERVHDAQRSEDIQFGDMCVKLQIITLDQLKEVLTKQKNSRLYIGEALVKVGALTAEALPGLLEAFKVDQAPYMIDKVAIPAGVRDAALCEIAADLTYKMVQRVANLFIRKGQCTRVTRFDKNDTVATLKITGSVSMTYLLTASTGARAAIAKAILKADDVSSETEEMLDDTVMEFINIVCGNIAAKAAQIGKTLEIEPPQMIAAPDGLAVADGEVGLVFPIYAAEGKLDLGLIVRG